MLALGLIGDMGLNVVPQDEIDRCKEMFDFYDEDSDGKLTYGEMLTCLRVCGRNPSVHEFKEMIQVVDTKLMGALDFQDFMSLYVMPLKDGPNDEMEMVEAFQAFDKAHNGFIIADDLKNVLTTMGNDKLTAEEADTMVKLADRDGDGVLEYDELISLLRIQEEKIETAMAEWRAMPERAHERATV